MAKAEGRKFNWDSPDKILTDSLESFEFNSPKQKITINTKEFSAVCPFSGLPDIADVIIEYYPTAGKCIELKSLKYYFVSFRNVGLYQEGCTKRIHDDLEKLLSTNVKVTTKYNTRGGIDVVCTEGTVKENFNDVVMRDQLIRAVGERDIKQVKMLIDQGADVNVKDDAGWTPLHGVAHWGHEDVVKLLISAGADVNVRNIAGWTPLHWAAYKGHENVVKLLISAGADVNARGDTGETPLHDAAHYGHTDVVKLLISAGADVNARGDTGWAPLHFAASEGHENIVKLLISAGAKE